ncbi:MAG: AAA family ATPase [Gemmatimonadota bacterium]|jgi:pilus assembly protein CpaE
MRQNGNQGPVRAALISTEESFRKAVLASTSELRGRLEVGLETDATPSDLLREPNTPLRDYEPHIIFLDLGAEPDDGIRLAGVLSRAHPGVAIVGGGPDLTQAQLLSAMRAGISEFVQLRSAQGEMPEAVDRILEKLGLAGRGRGRTMGRILTFFSPKGGTGCTTVAVNTGVALQELTGRKVLLVDLDLELGEIASFLGVKPRFHLVDLLKNLHRMDENLLTSYIERHESGVHLLSAPFEPETGQSVTPQQVEAVLAFVRKHYDYVVVDTSKSLAPPALAAMRPASQIFLVTNLDLCCLRNFTRCLPTLREIEGSEGKRIRLIVNRYAKNNLLSLEDLEKTVGLPVHCTLTNDFHTIIESISLGRPLVLHSKTRYATELMDLAARIGGNHVISSKRKKSLLGRAVGAVIRPSKRSAEAVSHA